MGLNDEFKILENKIKSAFEEIKILADLTAVLSNIEQVFRRDCRKAGQYSDNFNNLKRENIRAAIEFLRGQVDKTYCFLKSQLEAIPPQETEGIRTRWNILREISFIRSYAQRQTNTKRHSGVIDLEEGNLAFIIQRSTLIFTQADFRRRAKNAEALKAGG